MLFHDSLEQSRGLASDPSAGVRLAADVVARARRLAVVGAGWPAIYRVVAAGLKESGADPDTCAWYERAAMVSDRRSTGYLHFFARSYLAAEVWRQSHVRLLPDGRMMQRCLDDLAEAVLGPLTRETTDRVRRFPDLAQLEAKRLAGRLVPGLMLERTVWPAFAQLAHGRAPGGLRAFFCRLLPARALRLPRWICPAEAFQDERFLSVLDAQERRHVRTSADRAARHARRCFEAHGWVPAEALFEGAR